MQLTSRKVSVYLTMLFAAVAVLYWPFTKAFFQQDEWITFGRLYSEGYVRLNIGHFTPLTEYANFFIFQAVSFDYQKWMMISIFLHVITVYLVFIFSTKLFKSNYLGLLVALLFGMSASGHQAVSWISASVNTLGASIFGLLAMIMTIKAVEDRNSGKNIMLLATLFLAISLMFKEITIGLFGLIPLMFLIFGKASKAKSIFLIYFILGSTYVLFRGLLFLIPNEAFKSVNLATDSQSYQEVLYNIFSFPVKAATQTIIHPALVLMIGIYLTNYLPIATSKALFAEQQMSEIISISLFIIFSIVIYKFYNLDKVAKRTKKIILFSSLFVLLNGVIYALSPGRTGIITLINLRNLYFPLIGTLIIIVGMLSHFFKNNPKKILIVISPLIVLNIYLLRTDMSSLIKTGSLRKEILTQIKSDYPDLPDRIIFYTESDKSYYGMREKILPFQINFGKTLMVWYASSEDFPSEFLGGRSLLLGLETEGYLEIRDRGFGYFRDIDKLKKAISENNLPVESVIAYKYYSTTEHIINISDDIQNVLKNSGY